MATESNSSPDIRLHKRGENSKKLCVIASDHVGVLFKSVIVDFLKESPAGEGWDILDVGPHDTTRCDYPDYASLAAQKVLDKSDSQYERKAGVVICGSGIGISIAANKIHGIRCALCHDHYTAAMCRKHNDANMIALGARVIGPDVANDMVATFLTTSFDGDRHINRLDKLHKLEGCRYRC